jgi:hypothetical protein
VIDSAAKIMWLVVDTHENLVQVPASARIRMVLNALFFDLHGKHRANTVSLEPYHLVADVDVFFQREDPRPAAVKEDTGHTSSPSEG